MPLNPSIVFLGTPDIAASALSALVKAGFHVVGVVSQPDAPKGRGRKLEPSPVSQVALDLGLPLFRPVRLNKDHAFLDELKPDLLLTYAYGQILSTQVLSESRTYPPLNVHASDLPKLRGASPIQTALLEGDSHTAVCLMEMVKAMDAGRVFSKTLVPIDPLDDGTSLSHKIERTAIDLLLSDLPKYFRGELTGVSQDESQVTVCHVIPKSGTYLDPGYGVNRFRNAVRAFSQKPGAFFELENGLSVKVFKALAYPDPNRTGNGVLATDGKKTLDVLLSDGYVRLLTVQKQGKAEMAVPAFLNGTRGLDGMKLKPKAAVFPSEAAERKH